MSSVQKKLNSICLSCGLYGSTQCPQCPIEVLRQKMILFEMKERQTHPRVPFTNRPSELFTVQ